MRIWAVYSDVVVVIIIIISSSSRSGGRGISGASLNEVLPERQPISLSLLTTFFLVVTLNNDLFGDLFLRLHSRKFIS